VHEIYVFEKKYAGREFRRTVRAWVPPKFFSRILYTNRRTYRRTGGDALTIFGHLLWYRYRFMCHTTRIRIGITWLDAIGSLRCRWFCASGIASGIASASLRLETKRNEIEIEIAIK
jgi:hypothetical protein